MCVINISLNPTTPAGTTITNRNGRYRKVGTTTWTNFTISSNSYTLNVNDLGQYELQVNVTNSLGVVSSWASSTFSVTTDCGATTTTATTVTNSGIFNNGTTLTHSHVLPSADPASTIKTGTLTVTGSKTYKITVKNNFNYNNLGTGSLKLERNGGTILGTITVSTDGTSNTKTSVSSLVVPAGTYTYTLTSWLDIIPSATSGAGTVNIIEA